MAEQAKNQTSKDGVDNLVSTLTQEDRSVRLILVAARDEADRIGLTIAGLRSVFPIAHVVVADDDSRDDTADIARLAGAQVVQAGEHLGKGGAMSLAAAGANWDQSDQSDADGRPVVLVCDADLGDSASRLIPLTRTVADGGADLAVAIFASRVGGGFGIALRFARWAINERCGFMATAPISGQRALSLAAFDVVTPFSKGFGMEIGMTIAAVHAGLRVKEVEVDLAHRATSRTLRGFIHRGRQLLDFVRVFHATRQSAASLK